MNDCLSYADISEAVIGHVEGQRFALVERVAEEVADLLLTKFNSPWVRIAEQAGRGGARRQRRRDYRAWHKSERKQLTS